MNGRYDSSIRCIWRSGQIFACGSTNRGTIKKELNTDLNMDVRPVVRNSQPPVGFSNQSRRRKYFAGSNPQDWCMYTASAHTRMNPERFTAFPRRCSRIWEISRIRIWDFWVKQILSACSVGHGTGLPEVLGEPIPFLEREFRQ